MISIKKLFCRVYAKGGDRCNLFGARSLATESVLMFR